MHQPFPAYYCAKFARDRGFDSLLAGDGDEIFAGNTRYVKQIVFDIYRHISCSAEAQHH